MTPFFIRSSPSTLLPPSKCCKCRYYIKQIGVLCSYIDIFYSTTCTTKRSRRVSFLPFILLETITNCKLHRSLLANQPTKKHTTHNPEVKQQPSLIHTTQLSLPNRKKQNKKTRGVSTEPFLQKSCAKAYYFLSVKTLLLPISTLPSALTHSPHGRAERDKSHT